MIHVSRDGTEVSFFWILVPPLIDGYVISTIKYLTGLIFM